MVGVAGKYRSQKVGTECMAQLHGLLQAQGFALAALYGFRDAFYRRVGYATCGFRWSLSVPAMQMPALAVELPVSTVTANGLAVLEDCYHSFVRDLNGSVARTAVQWQNRMGETAPTIYAFGDPVEAYYWCKPEGFFQPLEIGEFVWSTGRGYRSALGHMRTMAVNKSVVEWNEPPSSPYLALYSDQRDGAKRSRPTMFRAIGQGTSALCEEAGWGLSATSDNYELKGTAGSVSLGCGALAQVLLGEPGVPLLAQAGALSGATPALERLASDFPASDVCCMEFF